MKSTKFFTSKSSLLAVGLLSASAALMALPAKAATVQVNLSDKTNTNTSEYPTVSVTLDDTSNPGKITATVNVVPGSTGYIGDLRGVYFNIPGVSGLTIAPVSGGPLTAISTNGDFKSFDKSADLQGTKLSFNAGVEVGKQGIAQGDDYRTTTFTISGNGLTLSAFTSQTVGARLMSVGDPNDSNRDLSSKTAGTAPKTVTASNPSGGGSTPAPAPAPAAETPVAPTAPAPAAETPTAPAPAPAAETPVAPTAPAPAAETPTAPAPAPVAETPAAPTAPAPVAETPAAPTAPTEPAGTPAPSNPGPGGDAEQVPEPATMAGSALGLAALMKWRKNRKATKSN
ncbi:MAG: PEP-CTERM sorting domain-containing protein [Microcoleus vaginatus WJT46-NPBG5]|nr:PEP-CTERM sorting domain-containing protein [Microcoleus vaginatus WJT46-NPBG5]